MSRRLSNHTKELAKIRSDHFYSEFILGEAIKEFELEYGEYEKNTVRKALVISNGWYSPQKFPPEGHSKFVQNVIKELGQLLSQNASIKPLVDRVYSSPYRNWCWLAESPEDITTICEDSLIEQEYSDGDWDTEVGHNYIIGMCFEFSGG